MISKYLNNKVILKLILFLTIIALSCSKNHEASEVIHSKSGINPKQTHEKWSLVLQTNKDGIVTFGSKAALIALVREGNPVRIGWESMGKTSVEHTIDVRFLTIANKTEVFAMLEPFWAQRPNLKSDTLSIIPIANETHWILSTNGLRSSMMVNKVNDTVINYEPQLFGYPIKWFVKK